MARIRESSTAGGSGPSSHRDDADEPLDTTGSARGSASGSASGSSGDSSRDSSSDTTRGDANVRGAPLSCEPALPGHASSPRFYAAERPAPPEPPAPSRLSLRAGLVATALVVLTLGSLALAKSLALRAALPLTGALAALALWMRGRRSPPPLVTPALRGLELTDGALAFRARGADKVPVLSVDEPFGVTLLATHARDRLVALVSSHHGTLYVGVRQVERDLLGPLVDHVTTVASDDAALDAVGPDGEPLLLEPGELARLVRDLSTVAPESLDRLVVGVEGAASLSLAPHELRVALGRDDEQVFDLEAPLEWRAIVFQEPIGAGVAVFQGTWVRQGAREVVLVAPLTLGGPIIDPSAGPIERGVQRDLRLMQAQPEDPPPRDKRLAIDRPLMLPLRSALDRAPRISVVPKRSATAS